VQWERWSSFQFDRMGQRWHGSRNGRAFFSRQAIEQAGEPLHACGAAGFDDLRSRGVSWISTARASRGSARRSSNPSSSSRRTICVIAGCVICSVAVNSVSRMGPRRESVCNTESVVKLSRSTEGNRMKIVVNSSMMVVKSLTFRSGSGK
jgi:hypothetical protein